MGQSKAYSRIGISLNPVGDDSADTRNYLDRFVKISLTTQSVPTALWGKPLAEEEKAKPPAASEQMIDNALVGLEIKTKAGPRPSEPPPIDS